MLQAQEESTKFDIHIYSDRLLIDLTRILDQDDNERKINYDDKGFKIENGPGIASFDEVVKGQDSAEVCRSFLACLQLANSGNLTVLSDDIEIQPTTAKGKKTHVNNVNKLDTICTVNNEFKVKMLRDERGHGIENFRAPSVIVK
jgi:hypothetical protein